MRTILLFALSFVLSSCFLFRKSEPDGIGDGILEITIEIELTSVKAVSSLPEFSHQLTIARQPISAEVWLAIAISGDDAKILDQTRRQLKSNKIASGTVVIRPKAFRIPYEGTYTIIIKDGFRELNAGLAVDTGERIHLFKIAPAVIYQTEVKRDATTHLLVKAIAKKVPSREETMLLDRK